MLQNFLYGSNKTKALVFIGFTSLKCLLKLLFEHIYLTISKLSGGRPTSAILQKDDQRLYAGYCLISVFQNHTRSTRQKWQKYIKYSVTNTTKFVVILESIVPPDYLILVYNLVCIMVQEETNPFQEILSPPL